MSLTNAATLGLSGAPDFVASDVSDITATLWRILGLGTPSPATGAPFSALYAFGDSLSSAGNDYALSLGTLPVSSPHPTAQVHAALASAARASLA